MVMRLLLAGLALVSLEARAADIYKCVDGRGTTYQATPCARGQSEVPMKVASLSARVDRDMLLSVPVTEPRRRGVWTRTAIAIGMSDDEVLNLPGWGRPTEISRARLARGWEEVWRYGNAYSGSRELRFVNARLADIADTPAAVASSAR